MQKCIPMPGIEPGPPGWKPGILTTRPHRNLQSREVNLFILIVWFMFLPALLPEIWNRGSWILIVSKTSLELSFFSHIETLQYLYLAENVVSEIQ